MPIITGVVGRAWLLSKEVGVPSVFAAPRASGTYAETTKISRGASYMDGSTRASHCAPARLRPTKLPWAPVVIG